MPAIAGFMPLLDAGVRKGIGFFVCHISMEMCPVLAHIPHMPPSTANPRRSDRLVARITPEDKSLLMRAATLEGWTLASFVVSHIR